MNVRIDTLALALVAAAVTQAKDEDGYTLGVDDRPISFSGSPLTDRMPLSAGLYFGVAPGSYTLNVENASGDRVLTTAAHAVAAGQTYAWGLYGARSHMVESFFQDNLSGTGPTPVQCFYPVNAHCADMEFTLY